VSFGRPPAGDTNDIGRMTMDRPQAEVFAVRMLEFIREQYPAIELVSLEVGRDDKNEVLWCKIHRSDEDRTHGGGYLFTVAYLDRIVSEKGG